MFLVVGETGATGRNLCRHTTYCLYVIYKITDTGFLNLWISQPHRIKYCVVLENKGLDMTKTITLA